MGAIGTTWNSGRKTEACGSPKLKASGVNTIVPEVPCPVNVQDATFHVHGSADGKISSRRTRQRLAPYSGVIQLNIGKKL